MGAGDEDGGAIAAGDLVEGGFVGLEVHSGCSQVMKHAAWIEGSLHRPARRCAAQSSGLGSGRPLQTIDVAVDVTVVVADEVTVDVAVTVVEVAAVDVAVVTTVDVAVEVIVVFAVVVAVDVALDVMVVVAVVVCVTIPHPPKAPEAVSAISELSTATVSKQSTASTKNV